MTRGTRSSRAPLFLGKQKPIPQVVLVSVPYIPFMVNLERSAPFIFSDVSGVTIHTFEAIFIDKEITEFIKLFTKLNYATKKTFIIKSLIIHTPTDQPTARPFFHDLVIQYDPALGENKWSFLGTLNKTHYQIKLLPGTYHLVPHAPYMAQYKGTIAIAEKVRVAKRKPIHLVEKRYKKAAHKTQTLSKVPLPQ